MTRQVEFRVGELTRYFWRLVKFVDHIVDDRSGSENSGGVVQIGNRTEPQQNTVTL